MGAFHTNSFLKGASQNFANINEAVRGDYDLLIAATSWDSRCLSLTQASHLKAHFGINVIFDMKDDIGLRGKHDRQVTGYLRSQSTEFSQVTGKSTDISELWIRLYSLIRQIFATSNTPLKVFLDLSTCPRVYALAIVGACIRAGIASHITIFYAEGVYKRKPNSAGDTYAFSSGSWEIVQVPFFEGEFDPGKRKYLLVSVGFEGLKTLQVVNKEDPDRISILFPDPGVIGKYAKETKAANRELLTLYKVPSEQIIRAAAGDAIAAWKALDTASVENPEAENTSYLCCGTKPHAIALGLRALTIGYPAVLYRVPERHEVLEVLPSGKFWLFEIEDLSSIP